MWNARTPQFRSDLGYATILKRLTRFEPATSDDYGWAGNNDN
jgi:hypothetical protein